MPSPTIVADRSWFAIAPDGTEHDVVMTVYLPYLGEGGEWRCPVTISRLELKPLAIAGIDSWQAIHLAMKFAATRLGHFADQGWKFYWERGGELAAREDLVIPS